ncbi:hypothetical protein CLOP_g15236 [Closterium sp. NIES-67]|nr:hypothetical protein CLOP_g15236 [Closterium sp. NIES-67]
MTLVMVVLGGACPSQAALAEKSHSKHTLSPQLSRITGVGETSGSRRLLRQQDDAKSSLSLGVREGEWVKVSDIVVLEAARAADLPEGGEKQQDKGDGTVKMSDRGSQGGLGSTDAFDDKKRESVGDGVNGGAGLAAVRSGNRDGTGEGKQKPGADNGAGKGAGGGPWQGGGKKEREEVKEEQEMGDDYVDDGEGGWAAQPGMRVEETNGGDEDQVEMFEDTLTNAEMKELARNAGKTSAAQGGTQHREKSGVLPAPASLLPLPIPSANAPLADMARRNAATPGRASSTGGGQLNGGRSTGQVLTQQQPQKRVGAVPHQGYVDVRKRQPAVDTGGGEDRGEQGLPTDSGNGAEGKVGTAGGTNEAEGNDQDDGDWGRDLGANGEDIAAGADTINGGGKTDGADENIPLSGDVEGGDGDERDYGSEAATMAEENVPGNPGEIASSWIGLDGGRGKGEGYDSGSVFGAENDMGGDIGVMRLISNSMAVKRVVGASVGGRARKVPGGGTGKAGYEGERKAGNHRKRTKPRYKAVDCQYREKGAFSKLHRCAVGYAGHAGVTGGYKRPIYLVTNNDDMVDDVAPGTIRYGLNRYRRSGVTIRFATSMLINLKQRLFLPPHTTIDGRGARVAINGGLVLHNITNVIIHNVAVGNLPGDHDVIHISNTTRVWVDHCAVYNAIRGTVDVVYGSTDVTISNCYIRNKNLTMLLGADDGDMNDANMRVTVYRNWFDQSGQRQPKARWGQIHVTNNLYTNWTYYCIGGRMYANIRSERNVFIAGGKRKEVTPWFGEKSLRTAGFDNTPSIRSYHDLLLNGATFHQFTGYTRPFLPPYRLDIHRANKALAEFVRGNAGPQVGSFVELACTEQTCVQRGDWV